MISSMTPRERWLALLDGQPTDRVPTDYWATPEVTLRLRRELGCPTLEALMDRLGVDRPRTFDAQPRCSQHPDDDQANIWGVRHRRVAHATGAYDEATTGPFMDVETVEQIHRFRWPKPDDRDYDAVAERLAEDDGHRPRRGGHYEPFLLYCRMRGMERAFEDMLIAPELVAAALEHLFDFHYRVNERTFQIADGRIDIMYLAEDLGSQHGPLFSLDVYRRLLLPGQQRMAALARRYGVRVVYHTDGAARPFLPDLVDSVGIDVLNPIQWRCPGMAREELAAEFGNRVAFHGGIDNQQTLAFGTVDDVVREVRQTFEIFRDCRWICAPCHNIQPVSPTENILAMYETIQHLGDSAASARRGPEA